MGVLAFMRRPAVTGTETRIVQPATGADEPLASPVDPKQVEPSVGPEPPRTERTITDFPELPEDLKVELDTKELCYCAISALQDRGAQERVLLWLCETLGVQR